MQYTMIYEDEIKQLSVLNSAGKHLFIALALHTKVEMKEENNRKFRVRKCFPSHDYLAQITGCSKSYVSKGIQNLRENGFLHTQQRMGTSSIYTITTSHTVCEPSLHTVCKPPSHTVYEHIKNNDQKELSKIYIKLTSKQIKILETYCEYFGWKKEDIMELEKKLKNDCEEYLTDELILLGAYNLKRKAEKKGVWTQNYFITGVVRWLETGKSAKPNIHMEYYIEKIHTDVLKTQPVKEQPKEIKTPKTDKNEDLNDFEWLLEYTIKQYNQYKSNQNKAQLEQLLKHNLCNQQHKHKINVTLQDK